MATNFTIFKGIQLISCGKWPVFSYPISTVPKTFLDKEWRRKKGFPAEPTGFGPLLNLPDYSYKDGRPSPLGVGQMHRLVKQRQYAETIVRLTKEMDFAVQRYTSLQNEKEETKQRILENKLKPKGHHFARLTPE